MTICIIPARSKSKRIKNKNIKLFNNKPIISYAIELAKKTKIFKRIIVSTDSKKIAKIAIKYGAEVPFIRKKKLSNDFTGTSEVLIDTIKNISSYKTKYHFCLYPTTALVTKHDLIKSFKKIKNQNSDTLIAVTEYNQSPLRALGVYKKKINFIFKKYKKYRTQDTPTIYRDSGTFYIYKTDDFIKKKGQLTSKSTFYHLDRYKGIDIDNSLDFQFAEFLYKKNLKRRKK